MFYVVDPGEVCGYMMLTNEGNILEHGEARPFETVKILHTHFVEQPPDLATFIVVERYTITPQTHKMTRQYAALETIGALRYVAAIYQHPVYLQSRAEKTRVANSLLISLGWHKTTTGGHANDAARHAFIALLKHMPNIDLVRQTLARIG